MSKKILGFIIAVLVLIVLAVLAYTNLEIRPRVFLRPPSREVLANDFFALEKWLVQTGHPVRFAGRGNSVRIAEAPEKAVFVQARAFDWENAEEALKDWIGQGGFLVVSLEPPLPEDEHLEAFLGSFGVAAEIVDEFVVDTDEADNDSEDSVYEEGPVPELVPDFDPALRFSVLEEAGASAVVMEDGEQIIRLVRISRGAGALTFMGRPQFMQNDYLKREVNARLAWDLTGARTGEDNPGLLFIRGRRQAKSLFGKVADRGNFLPLGLSLLILIVVGFWMVIPSFGLLFQEKEMTCRPIRERFLAEIRFLKKYRALETYLEVYIREIKRTLRGREADPELEAIEKSLRAKKDLPYKELVQNLQKLRTMMAQRTASPVENYNP